MTTDTQIELKEDTVSTLQRLRDEAISLDYPHMATDIDAVLKSDGRVPALLHQWLGDPNWCLTIDLGTPTLQINDVVQKVRELLGIAQWRR